MNDMDMTEYIVLDWRRFSEGCVHRFTPRASGDKPRRWCALLVHEKVFAPYEKCRCARTTCPRWARAMKTNRKGDR